MKISKAELIKIKACKPGLDRFIRQTGNTGKSVDVSSLIGGYNTYYDLLWLAGKKLDKERIVRFACDCALINIELIKPYTDKYDLIARWLQIPNNNYTVARAACRAAAAAYNANDTVACAAARATSCAYAAANTACVTAYAADTYNYTVAATVDACVDAVNELLRNLLAE